jgi:extradiol dioxygenase family protein
MPLTPFHLAIQVDDLSAAREFYGNVLGCPEGRSSDVWVDFDLYGHQLVCHCVLAQPSLGPAVLSSNRSPLQANNYVDGKDVPVPHFGVVLSWHDWEHLAARLRTAGTTFIIEPYVRFAGEVGEQATMFFSDPAGNMLEFKAFRDPARLFAH